MTVVDRDDSKPEPAERRRLGRALRHRNFRLFIGGQSISLIGTWMQQLGMSWLAYDLTRSAWLLALVNFAGQIPTLFLTPAAGVFADRWNRHRGLMVTQTAAMIQATTLVLLVWLGHLEVWHIVALSLVAGAINAFDMPLRQSFLVEMVPDRADLANAVAINSSIVNGARLVGPFIAGLLIAAGGAISCFLFNAISYVAVLFALGAMRDLQPRRHSTPSPVLRGLIEGLQYAGGFAPIRALLLMPALVSLVGTSLNMLMPVFADEILGGGPRLLGFLTGAAGIGALGAALVLLTRRSVVGLGGWIAPATTAFGASLIGLAFSRMVPLSLLLLVVAGFSMMFQMATSNTLLQTIVDEDKRGRVMSLYALAFLGSAPIGSLIAGAIAERFSAPTALVVAGIACLVGAAVFAVRLPQLRAEVRPIYRRMGLLPPVEVGAEGLSPQTIAVETAAELTRPPERSA